MTHTRTYTPFALSWAEGGECREERGNISFGDAVYFILEQLVVFFLLCVYVCVQTEFEAPIVHIW